MGRQSTYTREEKIAAVKLTEETGRNVASVANEYGVHPNTIWKWREKYRINPGGAFASEPLESSSEAVEAQRMKRRIAELEAEVDFLKKATAYFAKSSR